MEESITKLLSKWKGKVTYIEGMPSFVYYAKRIEEFTNGDIARKALELARLEIPLHDLEKILRCLEEISENTRSPEILDETIEIVKKYKINKWTTDILNSMVGISEYLLSKDEKEKMWEILRILRNNVENPRVLWDILSYIRSGLYSENEGEKEIKRGEFLEYLLGVIRKYPEISKEMAIMRKLYFLHIRLAQKIIYEKVKEGFSKNDVKRLMEVIVKLEDLYNVASPPVVGVWGYLTDILPEIDEKGLKIFQELLSELEKSNEGLPGDRSSASLLLDAIYTIIKYGLYRASEAIKEFIEHWKKS